MKLCSKFESLFTILIFLISILTASCKTKVSCINPELHLSFAGFDTSEMKVIEIEEYKEGTALFEPKRTLYLVKSVSTPSEDSVSSLVTMPYHYYQIKILHSNLAYKLHNIQFNKSFYNKDKWMGEADVCINEYVYFVDTYQHFVPMKIQESSLERSEVVIRKKIK